MRADDGSLVAVDIGGTKIAAGLVDRHHQVHQRRAVPTPASAGPEAVLDTVADLVSYLAMRHPPPGIGIAAAGVIDHDGRVRASTDALRDWADTDIRGRIRAAFGCPVTVLNDVAAYALGELTPAGAVPGARDVVAVAVGTGIGGAVVAGGRLLTGHSFAAGHLGHLPSAAAAGRLCPCGAIGHLEAVSSGPAMTAAYAARTGAEVSGLAEVARRAAAGDREATLVLVAGGAALGEALGGLVNVLDPEVVLLGGSVVGAGAPWLDAVRGALAGATMPALRPVPVTISALGGDAMLIGAAAAARAALDHRPRDWR